LDSAVLPDGEGSGVALPAPPWNAEGACTPVHVESPLGFTADFPEHTQVLEISTAGPNTEQYGLPGGFLVTVISDDTSAGAPGAELAPDLRDGAEFRGAEITGGGSRDQK
jgi:hypothetical protein